MPHFDDSISKSAAIAFGQKFIWLRTREGVSQKSLEKYMKQRGLKVSQTTVSNIETAKHNSRIDIYEVLAERYQVPLWVMFIPCEPEELLESEKLRRVVKLMEDYLACDEDERKHTENAASAFAAVHRAKS